jgi:hypothetical protein
MRVVTLALLLALTGCQGDEDDIWIIAKASGICAKQCGGSSTYGIKSGACRCDRPEELPGVEERNPGVWYPDFDEDAICEPPPCKAAWKMDDNRVPKRMVSVPWSCPDICESLPPTDSPVFFSTGASGCWCVPDGGAE